MFGKGNPGENIPSQQPGSSKSARQISPDSPEALTSIGADTTIVGKVIGTGTIKVFGRVEGEVNAADVLIVEGALVEGNVVAESVTIGGQLKGTIHAVRAKLLGTAKVDGDIFHRSLSIDENAIFEGSSRREEDPTGKKANSQPAAATPAFNTPTGVTAIDGHAEHNGAATAFAP